MDFTEIKDWILGICAGGITFNTILSGINLIKGTFSGIKVNKLMNFTAVADKNIQDNQTGFAELKKQFVANAQELLNDVKVQVVEPLKQEISALKADNSLLANLSVSLLSLVNVPIDEKRQFFTALAKISTVSAETSRLFEASIVSQENQESAEKTDNSIIEQNIGNS